MAYFIITEDNRLITFNNQAAKFKDKAVRDLCYDIVFLDQDGSVVASIPKSMIKSIFRSDTKVFEEMLPEERPCCGIDQNELTRSDFQNIPDAIFMRDKAESIRRCCCDQDEDRVP